MKDEQAAEMAGPSGSSLILRPSSLLAYAPFLACSWTWVIGMYLPVLLARDFGLWGWIVFTVPNVIGAAAMGWVLRSAAQSERFVERHGPAVVGFSLVTVCFHVFFLGWFLPRLIGPYAVAGLGAVIAAALVARLLPEDRRGVPLRVWASIGVFALSMAAFGYLLTTGPTLPIARAVDWPDLGGLAVVCTFGFALCPYLDLTFHEARQAAGPRGGLVFGLGFGVLFLVMLLFTLCYTGAILGVAVGGALAWVLAGHLLLQSTYTVYVHARALSARRGERAAGGDVWLAVGLSAACVVGIAASTAALLVEHGNYRLEGLSAGEVVYRCFMGFYGLAFPAYLWLCAAGLRGGKPSAVRLAACLAAVVLAVPFYALAFLFRLEACAGVAMLLIVAAKVGVMVLDPRPQPEAQQAGV